MEMDMQLLIPVTSFSFQFSPDSAPFYHLYASLCVYAYVCAVSISNPTNLRGMRTFVNFTVDRLWSS